MKTSKLLSYEKCPGFVQWMLKLLCIKHCFSLVSWHSLYSGLHRIWHKQQTFLSPSPLFVQQYDHNVRKYKTNSLFWLLSMGALIFEVIFWACFESQCILQKKWFHFCTGNNHLDSQAKFKTSTPNILHYQAQCRLSTQHINLSKEWCFVTFAMIPTVILWPINDPLGPSGVSDLSTKQMHSTEIWLHFALTTITP